MSDILQKVSVFTYSYDVTCVRNSRKSWDKCLLDVCNGNNDLSKITRIMNVAERHKCNQLRIEDQH